MTAMNDAFLKAGANPAETEFLAALAKYLGRGGTVERMYQLIADAIPDGKGHLENADKATVELPPVRTHREGEGQARLVAKAVKKMPTPREPSKAAKEAAKVARIGAAAAMQTALDFPINGYGAFGDLSVQSLQRMAAGREKMAWINGREAELLRCAAAYVGKQGHIPPGAKVRDVIDKDTAQAMIERSTATADMRTRITSQVAVG
jgi:hypothetical protein